MSIDPTKSRAATAAEVSCFGKVGITSFSIAQAILKRNGKNHRDGRSAYHCDHCQLWHIGTDNGQRARARNEHKHA